MTKTKNFDHRFKKGNKANPYGRKESLVPTPAIKEHGVYGRLYYAYTIVKCLNSPQSQLDEMLKNPEITIFEETLIKGLIKSRDQDNPSLQVALLEKLWPTSKEGWAVELDKALKLANEVSIEQQINNLKNIISALESQVIEVTKPVAKAVDEKITLQSKARKHE